MGTVNFHTNNASSIYVVYDRYYDEEDRHEVYRDWREIEQDIQCMGEQGGWEPYVRSFRWGRESDTAVLTKEYWFEYGSSGCRYRVDAYITINAGYYENCNLDFRLVLDGMDSDERVDDILDMMVEDFTSPNNCVPLSFGSSNNKYWNDGLRKMQGSNFRKAANEFLEKIVNECEITCEGLCEEVWKPVCYASNGECFYEKVG